MITDLIQCEIYEDVPEKPGYVRTVDYMTTEAVHQKIVDMMEPEMLGNMDYFHVCFNVRGKKIPDDYRRIYAYVVLGDNEGHYIHVDIMTNVKTETYFLGKTFEGFSAAQEMASYISSLFNDWSTYDRLRNQL